MIKRPPAPLGDNVFTHITRNCPEMLQEYLQFYRPVDDRGKYHPFDKFRFKVPSHLDEKIAWAVKKSARAMHSIFLFQVGESHPCKYQLTPTIQKAMSMADRHTTNAVLENMLANLGEQHQLDYLLNDLVKDESISSSQLEGAATTTLIAKDMISRQREPRTLDERMIIGNYRMMQFAWERKTEDLSVDLIREMHSVGVKDIEDEHYDPGNFRKSDDVVVTDYDENVVHQPPSFKGLEKRLARLCAWTNESHDEEDVVNYLHPLVKAMCLHFVIAYEHPFKDGNGRVARALFYWFMFRCGYYAFRYISISVLLKQAHAKYAKSYLYTETDEMDLTYFIDYQSAIVIRAINAFREAYFTALKDIENFNAWLWNSGLIHRLNDKQKTVFQVAKSGMAKYFTAKNVQHNLACSYNTAAAVLNGLVELNLFGKTKNGREWVYFMLDKDAIRQNWKTHMNRKELGALSRMAARGDRPR